MYVQNCICSSAVHMVLKRQSGINNCSRCGLLAWHKSGSSFHHLQSFCSHIQKCMIPSPSITACILFEANKYKLQHSWHILCKVSVFFVDRGMNYRYYFTVDKGCILAAASGNCLLAYEA